MIPPFVTVLEALHEFARGRMVVVVDDEQRENEGDLTMAAEFVTPEAINFMAKFGRGLICLSLTEDRADTLHLSPMTQTNTSRFGTAFTQSIEASSGVTTGISAHDRAHTIRVAIDAESTPASLARPGHIFPLRARSGGVLVRAGQTEASVDLARMAGLTPAGVICEIMNDDGTMSRVPDLIEFCSRHDLKMLTIAELIRYRLQNESYVRCIAEDTAHTSFSAFRRFTFESNIESPEVHTALVLGDLTDSDSTLVRVHAHALLDDLSACTHCECRRVVQQSMQAIASEGSGVLIYLHGTAPDPLSSRAALPTRCQCASQDLHAAIGPEERTLRHVGLGAQILNKLGVRKLRLLCDTPTHIPAFEGFGLEIVECVALPTIESLAVPDGLNKNAEMLSSRA